VKIGKVLKRTKIYLDFLPEAFKLDFSFFAEPSPSSSSFLCFFKWF